MAAATVSSSSFRIGHGSGYLATSGAHAKGPGASRVRISVCRAVCHSPLLTSSETSSRQPPPRLDFAEVKSKLWFSFLTEEQEDEDEDEEPAVADERKREFDVGVSWESLLPWQIMQPPPVRDVEDGFGPLLSPSRNDAPLVKHANVMWFKGPYNAEIVCGADEPAESIVRRFRGVVLRAGVISECHRRRYRESRQDVVKRKRKTAALSRRRRPT